MDPLVDLDEVDHGDVPLCGIAGHIPLKHSNHVVCYIAIVVRRTIRSVEADLPCGKNSYTQEDITQRHKEAIVKSLKTVPVDVCNLKRVSKLKLFQPDGR